MFFLYLLLLEAAGATSFDDLRTVAAMVCGSFREADMARGLADDDREHHVALEDAASLRSAAALRALFAFLSLQTEVADPPDLWHSFREALGEDFLRAVGTLEAADDAALAELQDLLPAEQNSSTASGLAAPRFAAEPPTRSGCSGRRSASTHGSRPPTPTARVQRRPQAELLPCRQRRAQQRARPFRLTCAAAAQLRCSPPSRRRCRPLPSTASPQPFRLPSMPLCNLSDSGGCLSAIFPDPKWKSRPGTAWARS